MSRKIPQKVKTQWKWKTTNGKVAIDKNIDVRILSFGQPNRIIWLFLLLQFRIYKLSIRRERN